MGEYRDGKWFETFGDEQFGMGHRSGFPDQSYPLNMVMMASCIAHLLEYIDTGEKTDYTAAMSNLSASGLIDWAKDNQVLLPVRRDGAPQFQAETTQEPK